MKKTIISLSMFLVVFVTYAYDTAYCPIPIELEISEYEKGTPVDICIYEPVECGIGTLENSNDEFKLVMTDFNNNPQPHNYMFFRKGCGLTESNTIRYKPAPGKISGQNMKLWLHGRKMSMGKITLYFTISAEEPDNMFSENKHNSLANALVKLEAEVKYHLGYREPVISILNVDTLQYNDFVKVNKRNNGSFKITVNPPENIPASFSFPYTVVQTKFTVADGYKPESFSFRVRSEHAGQTNLKGYFGAQSMPVPTYPMCVKISSESDKINSTYVKLENKSYLGLFTTFDSLIAGGFHPVNSGHSIALINSNNTGVKSKEYTLNILSYFNPQSFRGVPFDGSARLELYLDFYYSDGNIHKFTLFRITIDRNYGREEIRFNDEVIAIMNDYTGEGAYYGDPAILNPEEWD